jgi:tricorn protease
MNRGFIAAVLLLSLSFYFNASFAEEDDSINHSPDALMLRFPDVSKSEIVFVYGGDVWIVSREGGVARKLSSPKGRESFPKFSPEGDKVAFSGNYDGNTDIYVISSSGGTPERLTHHPEEDWVVDWYLDGESILMRSKMLSPRDRYNRLFRLPLQGGMPEVLPLPYGEIGSFSPNGESLAFQYKARQSNAWKRYKGGTASDLWMYNLQSQSLKKFTDYEGTDALPMWHKDTIYFLSDRGVQERLNIWAYDTVTEEIRQVTDFTEYDVKWPSLGPENIVFENGGALYLLDLDKESYSQVSVQVPDDLPELRPRLKEVSKNINNFSISPSGKRALFEARGEIFTVPQSRGSVRNLTQTSGVAERFPIWSPDGKKVAYFSDKTGEYELYIRPSDGKGEETRITTDGGVYRFNPVWSPDSKKIAYSDKTGSLFIIDISNKNPSLVSKDDRSPIGSYAWSPDSRWLTYPFMAENGLKSVMIYDTKDRKSRKVTTDFYNDNSPVFDPGGRYLYFYSDRSFTPVYGDMDDTWVYPNSTGVYALTLRADTLSPIAPRSDEETESKNEKSDENSSESVRIDFSGIEERVVKLPVRAGNFGALKALDGKVVYLRYPRAGASDHDRANGKLQFYSLQHGAEKTVIPKINDFALSFDESKLIYRSGEVYGIVDFGEGKNNGQGKIDISKLKTEVDPRQEWGQIFNDSWRIQRDFFYDPKMHGLDWDEVKARYEKLLPYIIDREDLNFVIGEMMGELNSSHTYIGGGDIEETDQISVGLLGADFELDKKNNAYRFKKIYGSSSNILDIRSPLKEPGLNTEEGDYLLTVNGKPLDTSKDPWASFQGLTGEVVELGISKSGKLKDAKEILIKPISKDEERRLRYMSWVEENRLMVEQATKGRVGYVYVPDTGRGGQNELIRQFVPQQKKEALIIDERFNGGGQVPDRFVEILNRPVLNFWAIREFEDWQTPSLSHTGPKVMLINGWAGSGGDAFPYYFRKAGLGPIIGTRTHGGLIGIGGNPGFVDGGYVTAPTYAFYNLDGEWDVEGRGVDPDYEVPDLPSNLNDSDDQQLDKALEVILELLKSAPSQKPDRPLYQDRSGGSVIN